MMDPPPVEIVAWDIAPPHTAVRWLSDLASLLGTTVARLQADVADGRVYWVRWRGGYTRRLLTESEAAACRGRHPDGTDTFDVAPLVQLVRQSAKWN